MQWRRWGLWLTYAGAWGLIMLVLLSHSNDAVKMEFQQQHATQAIMANFVVRMTCLYSDLLLTPIASLMVSDRLIRDRKLAIIEIQQAAPRSTTIYVLGKFIGNYIAMLVPTLLAIFLLGLTTIIMGWPLGILAGQCLAFVLIFMPVYAALIGLVLLLSTLLPLRSVQIGVPLLWFYSVLSPFHWTTINNTIFNPAGHFIFPVFFPAAIDLVIPSGYTVTDSLLNISALLAVAVVSLVILTLTLERQAQNGILH
jgi:hypothetical protein